MKIYKVIPRLERQRLLRLWHQALENQWSARAINWEAPVFVQGAANRDRMGRLLTPILMSEQTAFHSASAMLPILGDLGQDEAQYYLTTWIVDEARHAELFYKLFKRFEREPISPRKFPEAYYFQSAMFSTDVVEFLSGLLVTEVMAKKTMAELLRLDLDSALSQICERILNDEARHLGFNRIFTEDHVAALQASDPAEATECGRGLVERVDMVLDAASSFMHSLEGDLDDVGFDLEAVEGEIREESRSRIKRAVAAGVKAGEKLEAESA
jgi:hypothetical protein